MMSGSGFDRVGLSFIGTTGRGVQELLAPANNTRGIILRTVCIGFLGGTNGYYALYADTAAPTAVFDVTKATILFGGPNSGFYNLTREIFVPAGKGLWAVAGTQNFDVYVWLTYDEIPAK